MTEPTLRRHLNTTTLTLYGVGVMVGAGIYVLIGKVVGWLGGAGWMAFAGASAAALPTALSYAALASRFPVSAGEAVFVDRAFHRRALSFLVGFLVLASGVASTAAVSHGFASYFGDLTGLPSDWNPAWILGFLGVLTWLNLRGIEQATWVNVFCTVTSVSALLVLVFAAMGDWGAGQPLVVEPKAGYGTGAALVAAIALAFYAFIGFEDICNVAEEVRSPVRTIPRAILLSLGITTVLYIAVVLSAVATVPAAELAASDVPLVLVAERLLPSWPSGWLSAVALLAVTNTALFNLIMCSRILYGMARNGWIPSAFGRVHPRRQTPSLGVAFAFVLAATCALTGFLEVLAEATNALLLASFFAVNLALVVIQAKKIPPDDPGDRPFSIPRWVPVVGLGATVYLAAQFSWGAYTRALGLVLAGALLYAVQVALPRVRLYAAHRRRSNGGR